MPAPVASGWSGRRAGLAPAGKAPPCHGARGKRTILQRRQIAAPPGVSAAYQHHFFRPREPPMLPVFELILPNCLANSSKPSLARMILSTGSRVISVPPKGWVAAPAQGENRAPFGEQQRCQIKFGLIQLNTSSSRRISCCDALASLRSAFPLSRPAGAPSAILITLCCTGSLAPKPAHPGIASTPGTPLLTERAGSVSGNRCRRGNPRHSEPVWGKHDRSVGAYPLGAICSTIWGDHDPSVPR